MSFSIGCLTWWWVWWLCFVVWTQFFTCFRSGFWREYSIGFLFGCFLVSCWCVWWRWVLRLTSPTVGTIWMLFWFCWTCCFSSSLLIVILTTCSLFVGCFGWAFSFGLFSTVNSFRTVTLRFCLSWGGCSRPLLRSFLLSLGFFWFSR